MIAHESYKKIPPSLLLVASAHLDKRVYLREKGKRSDDVTPALTLARSSPTQSGQWWAENGHKYGYTFPNLNKDN